MRYSIVLVAIIFSLISAFALGDQTKEISKAEIASIKWLTVLDDGLYSQSWEEASTFWKTDHTKSDTERILKSLRQPIGKLENRKIISTIFLQVPDGDCVEIQFNSQMENGKNFIEIVDLLREKNGEWKVSLWSYR